MAFAVGEGLSERIAAIAPVAGACWQSEVKLKRPVPMHYITGTEDPLNPLKGGPLRFGLGGKDKPPVQDSVLRWVKASGLPVEPSATDEKNGIRTMRYAVSNSATEVRYTNIDGHGHVWPGSRATLPEALVGKATGKCNATDLLWEFFSSHRLVSGSGTSGKSGKPEPARVNATTTKQLLPGDHMRMVQVDQLQRRYQIHIPQNYDASHATPVVIAFHGGGGNPESMIRLSGLNAKSDEAGFLVVYPFGSGPLENQFLTFNGGGCCGYAMENKVDDVAFTRELLDDLATVTNVDADRVFATGLSNGGIMSHYLASELSDRIAAIAAVGGPLMMGEVHVKRPVSVMHFHGTADAFAPFQGGTGEGFFPGRKGVTDFTSVDHTMRCWVKANGCQVEPRLENLPDKSDDGMTVTRKTWSGGRDGSEVVLIEIQGGGHTWPGKEPTMKKLGSSTKDISANDLMWEFFQQHPRTKKISAIPQQAIRTERITRAVDAPRVERRSFESRAAKTTVSYHMVKPQAYDMDGEPRFPVLYWLHGTGGGLLGIPKISEFFDRAMQEGHIPPMLVVFANGLSESMWCDSKDGGTPIETVLIKELIPHIDATYRTIAAREGRIIEGFSMGGYGAARLGFKYPQLFGAVSILAGGPLDLDFAGPRASGNPAERARILKEAFGGDLDYYRAEHPITIAEQQSDAVRGKVMVRMAVGSLDSSGPLNRAYSAHLTQLKIDHNFFMVPDVGHDTLALLQALGEKNWEFYCNALSKLPKDVAAAARQAVPSTEHPWVLPEPDVPRMQRVLFDSKSAGEKVSYYVFIPQPYDIDKERRFPVLYWLHGSGGSSPSAAAQMARRYSEAMRAGKIPPMILIFPNGLPKGMWCDWKDGSVKLETMFISELMPHIDRTFRTQAKREGRIIEGFSMGGYGAARIGFKHPHLFAAVSLLGAGPLQAEFTVTPRATPRERDRLLATVYGNDMDYFREQSPWQIVERNAQKLRSGLLIRQIVGDSDETLHFNQEFKQHLDALKLSHIYFQLPGVPHEPNLVLTKLGEANWQFYRDALTSQNKKSQ